jgi:hypothetical protein
MERTFEDFVDKNNGAKIEDLIARLENEEDGELEEIVILLTLLIF